MVKQKNQAKYNAKYKQNKRILMTNLKLARIRANLLKDTQDTDTAHSMTHDDCINDECGFDDHIDSCIQGNTTGRSFEWTDREYNTISSESVQDDWPSNPCMTSQHKDLDTPLFPGSSIAVSTTMTLILYLVVNLGICSSKVTLLLAFVGHFLPSVNELPSTEYLFYKYFGSIFQMRKISFCSKCRKLSGALKLCPFCQDPMEFILCRMPSQLLKEFMADREKFKKAQYYRTEHNHSRPGVIRDIFDGQVYKSLGDPITRKLGGFTLQLSWDGASKFKSSLMSAWPVYLTIQELAPHQRYLSDNILFCALWFGNHKPDSDIIFAALAEDLQLLEKGTSAVDPHGNHITLKARILSTCLDLPAKASFFKMIQHGGACACSFCKISGLSIMKRFCYPLQSNDDNSLRSSDHLMACYEMLKELYASDPIKEHVVHGIKGEPYLCQKLSHFSMVDVATIDIMHLCEGIHKLLIKLWTKPKYSVNKKTALISKSNWILFNILLTAQKLPSIFHRAVRSIIEHGSFWKASECMTFLLYFSPLLKFFLPLEHFEHHMLLVDSLRIMLSNEITLKQLDEVEKKLKLYVLTFQDLYGKEYVTLNIHHLIHLPLVIYNHGPLWCYSTFPYESLNHTLLSAIHGTYRLEAGICRSLALASSLPTRLTMVTDIKAQKTLEKMGCYLFNSCSKSITDKVQVNANSYLFKEQLKIKETKNVRYFKAMRMEGILIEAHEFVKQKTFCNSFVSLRDGRKVQVGKFLLRDDRDAFMIVSELGSDGLLQRTKIMEPVDKIDSLLTICVKDGRVVSCYPLDWCWSVLLR